MAAAAALTPAARRRRRGARPHAGRRLLRVLAVALPAAALAAGLAWFLDAVRAAAAPPDPRPTDGIVVLTGGPDRVRTGLRLLAEDRARLLLISGVHPDATLAQVAAAAGGGVDPAPLADRVALGRAARSTRGNAAEAAAWARAEGLGSLRVVTAAAHLPRALLELRRALPPPGADGAPALVPHPVGPAPAVRGPLLLEYAKTVAAALGLGRLWDASPAAGPPPPPRPEEARPA